MKTWLVATTLVFSSASVFADTTSDTPKIIESPPSDRLSVLAFGRFNFVNTPLNDNTFVDVGSGLHFDLALTSDTHAKVTFDAAPAYGYIITTRGQDQLPPFNERAFVDELYLDHNLNDSITVSLGKMRFIPGHEESPLPFGPSNPLTLHQTMFPVYSAKVDIHSDDKKHYLQFYLGEAQDGQFDLDLQSSGTMFGVKGHTQLSDLLALHGSLVLDHQQTRPDFVVSTVGASLADKKRFLELFANLSYFENSPYRFNPDSQHSLETGVVCRPNPKNEFGIVGTCISQESNQAVFYYKRNITPTIAIKGYIGYQAYDKQLKAFDFNNGPMFGVAVDIIQALNPIAKSLFRKR